MRRIISRFRAHFYISPHPSFASVCTINIPRRCVCVNGRVLIIRAPMMVTRKRLCGSGKEGLDRAWGKRSKSGIEGRLNDHGGGSIAHARETNRACDRVVAGTWNAVSANRCSEKKVRARVPLRSLGMSGWAIGALSIRKSSRWSDEKTTQVRTIPFVSTLVFW